MRGSLAEPFQIQRQVRLTIETGGEHKGRADQRALTGVVPPQNHGDQAQLDFLSVGETPVVLKGETCESHDLNPSGVSTLRSAERR